jgi:hypothetical protein
MRRSATTSGMKNLVALTRTVISAQSFEALPAKSRDQQKLNEGVQFRWPGFPTEHPVDVLTRRFERAA